MNKEKVIQDLEALIKGNYFIFGWTPKQEIAQLALKYKNEPETRIINLYDSETNYLVQTDAPAEEIHNAIAYKNQMLENDDPSFRSDFEEMQSYLQEKGYTFEQFGYVNDIEGYCW